MQNYVHGELKLKYSFPFKQCGFRKYIHIYIFGAGKIGHHFQNQLNAQDKNGQWDIIENLGFIDNFISTESADYQNIKNVGVYKPQILKTAVFDSVVLACKPELIPEIMECLFENGVDSSKILLPDFTRPVFYSPNMGDTWNHYYQRAEKGALLQYNNSIAPLLAIPNEVVSLQKILDFPSGRGRIAEIISKTYNNEIKKIVCCDANSEAVQYCRERFSNNDKFEFMVNEVDEWRCNPLGFPNDSFTFVLSWDAMVHFSYKWIDFYINEFYRILQKDGYALVHHSNLASPSIDIRRTKSETWNDNPGGRTLVSAEDVKFISEKCGFHVIKQTFVDIYVPNMDCITLLKKNT